MNSPSRRAKIVATLGPASSDPGTIADLLEAGVNVVRLNFSHGTREDHETRVANVRAAAKRLDRPVAILQDLQGPKLRVGRFPAGQLPLEKGENVVLRLEKTLKPAKAPPAEAKIIPYNYGNLASEIRTGHRILLDDGNLELTVTGVDQGDIHASVVFGGLLKDHKGMNFPDTRVTIESFTPKDREDLAYGLELGIDYVALSFVKTASDVLMIKKFIQDRNKSVPVVAKIEKAEAVENLAEILAVSDALMVARGDLAVEVGTAQVPTLQKKIIRACNRHGIPVITATQMLESMISSPRPTRAEASDVANAVLDGTDALMLSAETASGRYPTHSVAVMHNIILETEQRRAEAESEDPRAHYHEPLHPEPPSLVEALEHAASRLATWIDAKAIACTTHTGRAARALARYRPQVPILAFTDSSAVRRQLALVWGVESSSIEPSQDLEKLFVFAEVELARRQVVRKGDRVVLTAGWPPLKSGTTNLLKVVTVRSDYMKI